MKGEMPKQWHLTTIVSNGAKHWKPNESQIRLFMVNVVYERVYKRL